MNWLEERLRSTIAYFRQDLRVTSEWVDRYGHRIEESRLPRSQQEREAVAELIGRDGSNLLAAISAADAPLFLQEIPAVQILRRIWLQNYVWIEGQLRWRSNEDLPPGKQFINSPYDQEARYGKKRETRWTGYKVHITETCEEDAPHLITHVATTAAATTDEVLTETIHADLQQVGLTPRQHLGGFWLYHRTHSSQQASLSTELKSLVLRVVI